MRSLLFLAALAFHGASPAFNVADALAPHAVRYDQATSTVTDKGRVVGFMYVHDDELGPHYR